MRMKDIKAILRVQELFYQAVVWPWSLFFIRHMVTLPGQPLNLYLCKRS